MSIRRRGARSYQVRVSPFPAQTVPTRDAAEKLELDLKTRKLLGAVYEEAPTKLGYEIDALLARIEATRDPRPATVKFNRTSAKDLGAIPCNADPDAPAGGDRGLHRGSGGEASAVGQERA